MNRLREWLWHTPVSPIVANLYMEHFERKALRYASNPPWFWFRFVDDTWVIQQQAHKQAFLDHISSIDPAIKFTVEGTQRNRATPVLDTLVTLQVEHFLSITVYHKPTHTDQYLQWDSHHIYQPSTVSLVHLPTGLKQFALDQSFSRGNYNTLRRL